MAAAHQNGCLGTQTDQKGIHQAVFLSVYVDGSCAVLTVVMSIFYARSHCSFLLCWTVVVRVFFYACPCSSNGCWGKCCPKISPRFSTYDMFSVFLVQHQHLRWVLGKDSDGVVFVVCTQTGAHPTGGMPAAGGHKGENNRAFRKKKCKGKENQFPTSAFPLPEITNVFSKHW